MASISNRCPRSHDFLAWWVVLASTLFGCQSPEVRQETPLEEPIVQETSPRLPTEDSLLSNLPEGELPWDRTNTPIIIHTALESRARFGRYDLPSLDQLNNASGFTIRFSASPGYHGKNHLPSNSEHPTLIALDAPELRIDGALHFFEVRGDYRGKQMDMNRQPSFWSLRDDVMIHSPTSSHQLVWFVQDIYTYDRPRPWLGDGDAMEIPTIRGPFLDFASRCQSSCEVSVYVWKPQSKTLDVLTTHASYHGKKEMHPARGKYTTPALHVRGVSL